MSIRKKVVITNGEPITWWLADYSDGAGKRHQRRFKTKKEAAEHHDKTKTAIRAGHHVSLPSDLTIAGAADKWLNKVGADAREFGTLKQYRQHCRVHILPLIGNQKLAKMTKGHVEQFRDGLINGVGEHKALSRPTAKKVLVSLKSILKANNCAHLGDGVSIVISARNKERLEVRDIPTTDEVSRMLKVAKGRWRALLMVAVFTGLRASEMRGLRWCDVDFKAGEIKVQQRADAWLNIGAPKSEASRRTVPIGPELLHVLKEWRLACPKEGDRDLVFPTSTGEVCDHKSLQRGLGIVMTKAGVLDRDGRPKFGVHAFRHFFASWCINSKAKGGRELPAKEVQTLLGHSSIVVTLDIYGHLFPTGTDRHELAASEKMLLG